MRSERGSLPPESCWRLVVPVKPLGRAKSRLGFGTAARTALALAFALDTVSAAIQARLVAGVLVVTDDERVAAELADRGALVVADAPDRGLNPALAYGAAHAAAHWPGCGVAALSADLPGLRPAELDVALRAAAARPRSFLPDTAGQGTTLLTAAPGVALDPRFGVDSRRAHAASGAAELPLDGVDSLRRDVDTPTDLRDVLLLGVGPATAAVLTTLAEPGLG